MERWKDEVSEKFYFRTTLTRVGALSGVVGCFMIDIELYELGTLIYWDTLFTGPDFHFNRPVLESLAYADRLPVNEVSIQPSMEVRGK